MKMDNGMTTGRGLDPARAALGAAILARAPGASQIGPRQVAEHVLRLQRLSWTQSLRFRFIETHGDLTATRLRQQQEDAAEVNRLAQVYRWPIRLLTANPCGRFHHVAVGMVGSTAIPADATPELDGQAYWLL